MPVMGCAWFGPSGPMAPGRHPHWMCVPALGLDAPSYKRQGSLDWWYFYKPLGFLAYICNRPLPLECIYNFQPYSLSWYHESGFSRFDFRCPSAPASPCIAHTPAFRHAASTFPCTSAGSRPRRARGYRAEERAAMPLFQPLWIWASRPVAASTAGHSSRGCSLCRLADLAA